MEITDTNPTDVAVRTRALLLGTQLAVATGSLLLTLYCVAIVSETRNTLDGALAFAFLLFMFLLMSSFVIVNCFVILLSVPTYFLCKPPAGRVAGTVLGAFCGVFAFGLLRIMLHPNPGNLLLAGDTTLFRGGFGALPGGGWVVLIIPALYGALVGLFTAELEGRRSHVA